MPKLTMVLNKVGKTINLARPSSYQIPRKPPMNTLIFEKLPEPQCGDKVTCGIKGPPITKPVRVCTKEDMQAFYCPPPCDCKIKPQPLTFSQKVDRLVTTAFKTLIVGGLIYYTYEEGLWSDAFKSSCFLGKFIEQCPPEEDDDAVFKNEFMSLDNIVLEDPEPCQPFIPRMGVILYTLSYVWNKSVIFVFWLILDAPFEMIQALLDLFKPKPEPPPEFKCPS